MSLNFSIANVVYVKNLSPDVSENDIKEKFESCDEIINVDFKNFPGRNQKYCQIEFKSSEGITKASRLNGETLLNVPMVVTVIEPVLQNQTFNDILNNNNDGEKTANNSIDIRGALLTNSTSSNGVNSSNIPSNVQQYQNLQNLLLQKQLISEQKKGLVDFQNSLNEKNNKFDVFSKIIYMENIPENYTEEDINRFFENVGKTTSYKLQYNEQKKVHTAFVEFKNEEHAKAALNLNGVKVGNYDVSIRDAYSLISEKDNLKNNFSFYSTGNNNTAKGEHSELIPVNKQVTVNKKVEQVLALKEKLTLKLCAMYNPNLLLVNNIVQANQFLLNTTVENDPAGNSNDVGGGNNQVSGNNQVGGNNNDEKQKVNEAKVESADAMTDIKNSKEETQQADRKRSEEGKKEKTKKKISKCSKYSDSPSTSGKKSLSRNSDRSSASKGEDRTSLASRSSPSRSHTRTRHRRSHSRSRRRSISRSRNHRRKSKTDVHRRHDSQKYDRRRKRKRSSHSRNYIRTKSNSVSSYESNRNSRYHSKERKKSKIRRKKYYSSSSSYSNSSYASRRRRRESGSNKPWWVKESEKMEMRQRLKEKQMRELAYRERYRRYGSP
ncbi:RNA-binding protein, putative [Plasmodium ovale wallikeri]|uniref:RNA-binding protein, putative n=1 Tax=Plasmodium ovale wallikeri TaxID=864142 RepID=A0A1A8ZL37_PLAOA|nr:RNA-binding protein, putative [Plasmodium ovale wallikeri]